MTRLGFRVSLFLALALLLVACNRESAPEPAGADNSRPAQAVLAQVKLLRQGDFDGLMRTALPPDDYAFARESMARERREQEPPDDEEAARFAEWMQRLTAPDAEARLLERARPLLADYARKYKAQLPLYVGMGQTIAATAIQQTDDLDADEKKRATNLLSSLAQWVQGTDWGDEALARKAISRVVNTAREVDVATLAQLRDMDHETLLRKAGTVWTGTMKVLSTYGLDLGAMLDGVQARTIAEDGGEATVRVDFELFGEAQSTEVQMVEQDGRWYAADVIRRIAEARAERAEALVPPAADTAA